jgi:BirA family biotin operon repressor/biotin-[acetyl-CoA-carboxylase] ligase
VERTSRVVQVLEAIQKADGFVSGAELARKLGVSRTAIWKLLDRLQSAGLEIESKPGKGYRLIGAADRLTEARILAGLNTKWLGHEIVCYEQTDSTNIRARELAETGAPHGLVITAEHQPAGRGRLDRKWLAPRGRALLVSILLRPRLSPRAVFGLTMAASVCLVQAVADLTSVRAQIKWPNDVYADDKKLAGILTEFSAQPDVIEHAVIGVGINVNQTAVDLERLDQPAASLRVLTGRRIDRTDLLRQYLVRLEPTLDAVETGRNEQLKAEYDRLSLVLGRQVTVAGLDQTVQGRAVRVAADGSLIVATDHGQVPVTCGDVNPVRLKT